MEIEIEAIGKHVAFARMPFPGVPEGLLIGGICLLRKNKSISAGHAKTGAYFGENRKLDTWICVTGFQEFADKMHHRQRYNFRALGKY